MQQMAILGATGSIGQSTLDVIRRYPDRFSVHTLVAGHNVEALVRDAKEFHVKRVVVADESLYETLKSQIAAASMSSIEVAAGSDAVRDAASDGVIDTVLQAIVGAAGLAPTFAAVEAGKRLLLANKESVVCGGSLLMDKVQKNGVTLLPVDSEHNAIFQCLEKADSEDRAAAKIWLTCSGGPFRTKKDLDFETVTPEIALSHPTWKMGRKISIDSATLMNKGFEVIEARHLFDIPSSRIEVIVHPQSVIHSMVEFPDGSVIAQMGPTDMRFPIAHCLGYPERLKGSEKRLDFKIISSVTFEAPDTQRFPLLTYAYEALEREGYASVALNAANEIAVEAFLDRKISFAAIHRTVRAALDRLIDGTPRSLSDILEYDSEVRQETRNGLG